MKRIIRFASVSILLLASFNLFSQNKTLDSIKIAIENAPNDTNKVNQYLKYIKQCYRTKNLTVDSLFHLKTLQKAIKLSKTLNHYNGIKNSYFTILNINFLKVMHYKNKFYIEVGSLSAS